MKYTKSWSSTTPGCFLFLIDQSGSTRSTVNETGVPLAEEIARVLNNFIAELIPKCSGGGFIKDRVHVGMLGYFGEDEVRSLLPGSATEEIVKISDLQKRNLGTKDVAIETVVDGQIQTITEKQTYWLDATAGGRTPMNKAFRTATTIIAKWIRSHSESYPPIVVNITDGKPTDGSDLTASAKGLTDLETEDGNVLLLNIHLTPEFSSAMLCPSSDASLPDEYARMLWRISSPLPSSMLTVAPDYGLDLPVDARGMAFNATIDDLIRLLDFGSQNV